MTTENKIKLTSDLNFVQIASVQDSKILEDASWVIFYCKKCEEIVDVNKIGKKLVFECKKCKSKDIAIWTAEGINKFYKINK